MPNLFNIFPSMELPTMVGNHFSRYSTPVYSYLHFHRPLPNDIH